MIEIRPTSDAGLIREMLTHPAIYPYMVSDGAPARETVAPDLERVLSLLVYEGDSLLGMFLCDPLTRWMWQIHTCLLPGVGARRAIAAYRAGLRWLGANTTCQSVIGFIASDNPRALVVALRGGARVVGTISKSIVRGGVLLDQTIVAAEVSNHG